MNTEAKKTPPVPLPAATILLVRDGPGGLEAFMVKRHHQIDFASGALVFPGGKADARDFDPALKELADGAAGWSSERLALAAAAIREAFEEAGILLAREAGGTIVGRERLAELFPNRRALEKGETGLAQLLAREKLRLACDLLVPFAHWITPTFMPKRFDTHFFLAAAPEDQQGIHDGRESVDSIWISPHEAVADPKRWTVIFPTRMNLQMLGRSATVAAALERARAHVPVTVEPWVEDGPDGKFLRIRADAGYGEVAEPLSRMM